MSKIDLSKAKIGDKFRTRSGSIRIYYECQNHKGIDHYLLKDEDGNIFYYHKYGNFILLRDTEYDLVEQVLDDEKDRAITDKILKDVEKVVNGVAEAMPLIESATIANLPREQLPENNEDDSELQRRQEVVDLAERIFTNFENSTIEGAFRGAEIFIKFKNKYLKDGKLC